MIQMLLALVHGLADITRAVCEVILRRRRSRYEAAGSIDAPLAAVWELIMRQDVTFVAAGVRMRSEPIPGHEGAYLAHLRQGEKTLPGVAFRYEAIKPPTSTTVRYLKDLSPPGASVGVDDIVTVCLVSAGERRTRVSYARELNHTSFSTRIAAPIGLRAAVAMTTAQAELEAGKPAHQTPLWHQLVWTTLAFLSFAWLLDWRLALAVMGIIAVHEFGHALFMLRYGLGINFVSFVPFLGGVAAPKRYYESEWQRGIVALMGVGFSLPITFGLIAVAHATDSPNLAAIAILSTIINAVNLVPFPALDGSAVVSMLLGKLHRSLNLAVTILMFGLFVALGIILNSPLIWAAIALSFISVVQVMSLKIDDHLIKMGLWASLTMLTLYFALIVGHVVAFRWATTVTARTENKLITNCIRDSSATESEIRRCREAHRLWILPE